ncbi:Universal stress protein family protein [Halopseudomonas xinjiangensis]|uniref:Universal stress protein family protein n=1 Tax=Halopseudomonas xinjiangensis TaxID=487184 RepID=A0A1H1L3G8_9GAMM|nr:universal stress protein [Halopseudomonas xinjiangensis]SDR69033.1 Universal stress protein family protein [Halopseudomonas xinjiangensis]
MLKHCILSVDYSDEWDKIYDHLPNLIQLLKIERMTLVYAVEPQKRHHLEDNDTAIDSRLRRLGDELSGKLGITADHEVRHGFPAAELSAAASKHEANAIIALNRSHSAGRAALFGNSVMHLARVSRVPVLVIPYDGKPGERNAPLVLATDGSDAARNAQRLFEGLAHAASGSKVVWVKDDDAGQHDEERMEPLLDDFQRRFKNLESKRIIGDPAEKLTAYADQESAALVIIGKRGNTPIPDLLVGSTAEAVARSSHRPVLLVP